MAIRLAAALPAAPAAPDEWMTSGEAARYLRLSRDRFEALRRQRKGPPPACAMGKGEQRGRIRYRRSELDAWLLRREGQEAR